MILQVISGLFISYILLFILSIIIKDNSIADIFWGLGFLQVTIHSFYLSGTSELSQILFNVLIMIWSLRISLYIFSKKLVKKGEDPRYAAWRNEWKHFYVRSFFQVFMLQGVLLLIISLPIFLINISPPPVGIMSGLGIAIASFGLIYETIADLQLRSFIQTKKKGGIMTKGLWRYSRHPNYFGESVFWLGASIIASQVSLFTFVSWVLITVLLRFVSGVPLAEARYKDNTQYQIYKKNTPPMFPRLFK